jgi:hypothetical protein
VGGITYPVWSSGQSFTMRLDWEPTVFSITDGKKTVSALFNPEQFGVKKEETIYSVDGIYTFTKDKQSRPARLFFQNGLLRSVATFTEEGQSGAAREIVPQAGDTFTLLERWLDLDASGKITGSSSEEGEVLTFGTQSFKWVEQYAAAGEYVVGFIVEDLDGNSQQVYKRITVR